MVKNRSEFEKIVNPEVLNLIDEYHKAFSTELSMNINFNMKNFKFNLPDFYRIIKEINIDFRKELEDLGG